MEYLVGRRSKMLITLAVLTWVIPCTVLGQQYGTRSFSLAPDGLNVASLMWEHQELSLDPSGSILFKDAKVRIDAVSLTYSRYFELFGKTAQINAAIPYVSIDAATGTTFQRPPLTGLILEADPAGFADPYAHIAVALIGGDSIGPEAFADQEAGFAVHGLFALRPPLGEYSEDLALNPGQNRWEFRLGLPITQQWGKPGKQTTLDFTPVVALYTDNDKPFGASKLEQNPLVHLEAHVSRDFIPGLLAAGLDVNYVFGGETALDDTPSDNEQDYWTAGISLGGRFSREIGWGAVYSRSISATDALDDSDWFRINVNYSF